MEKICIFAFCLDRVEVLVLAAVCLVLGLLAFLALDLAHLHTIHEKGYTTWDLLDDLQGFQLKVRRWMGVTVIFRDGEKDDILPYGALKIRWREDDFVFYLQRVEVRYENHCVYHDVWQGSHRELSTMLRGRATPLLSLIKNFGSG